MRALGFARFRLAGTIAAGASRTGCASIIPQAVERVAVLDISPTRLMYAQTDFRRSPPPTTTGSS